MKLLKLVKEYDVQVRDIADKISHIVPDPSPNTDLTDEQESAVRALLDQPAPVELAATSGFSSTAVPTDEELASAALDGMIADYSNRLRGQAIANTWIEQRADGQGNATDNPVIQKKIQVVLMLRKLGIPQAPAQPVPVSATAGAPNSGISLPPLVQAALENAFPDRMQRINSPLPDESGREAPQLQGAK
ncbi:MAG: hypothetical protein WA885_04845 [Phormidesmis sp.]